MRTIKRNDGLWKRGFLLVSFLFIIMVMIISSSSVLSVSDSDLEDAELYWDFRDGGSVGTTIVDYSGNGHDANITHDWLNVSSPISGSGLKATGGGTEGVIETLPFVPDTTKSELTLVVAYRSDYVASSQPSWASIVGWGLEGTSDPSTQANLFIREVSNLDKAQTSVYTSSGGAGPYDEATSMLSVGDHMAVLRYNSSHVCRIQDNSGKICAVLSGTLKNLNYSFGLNKDVPTNSYSNMKGVWYQVAMWYRALNDSELDYLYNSSNFVQLYRPEPSTTDNPPDSVAVADWLVPNGAGQSFYNTSLNLSWAASVDPEGQNVTYRLYVNNSLIETTNNTYYYWTPATQGDYILRADVSEQDNLTRWVAGDNVSVTYDRISITLNLISAEITQNGSLAYATGYANATHPYSQNISYAWKWYTDGTLYNQSSVNVSVPSGQKAMISQTGAMQDDTSWVFSVQACNQYGCTIWYNSTAYNQTGIIIRLYDENDGSVFNLTSHTITFSAICPYKTISKSMSGTEENLSIDCPYTLVKLNVESGSSSYFRTLIPLNNTVEFDWYIANLLTDTVVQRVLNLDDLTGDYSSGVMTIRRGVNQTIRTIIEQEFDIENSVTLYLMKNAYYTLRLTNNDGNILELGSIIADSAGSQNLVIPTISFIDDGMILGNGKNWNYTYDEDGGFIKLAFYDTQGDTTWINWTVYENSTDNPVFSSSYSSPSSVLATYNGVKADRIYLTSLQVESSTMSNIVEKKVYGSRPALTPAGWTQQEWNSIIAYAVILFLFVLVMGASPRQSSAAMVLVFLLLVAFNLMELVAFNSLQLALMGVLAVIGFITKGVRQR